MSHTLKVVLDTNVLLSGIAFPTNVPGKIMSAWRHGSIEVLLSKYILDELARVLPRLSHRHQLTAGGVDDLLDLLAILADMVEPREFDEQASRDINDLPVLGTLISGLNRRAVDYLITGDKDLLVLSDRYPIVSPAQFWAKHGSL